MTALIDLTGRQFGGLRVLGRGPSHPSRLTLWTCRCDGCGRTVDVPSQALRLGRTRSCGSLPCRGAYPLPSPAEALADNTAPDSLGTVVALLRASVDDDHDAIAKVTVGIDEDDDLVGIVLQLLRLCSTALVAAEGSQVAAHRVLHSLAAMDRRQTR